MEGEVLTRIAGVATCPSVGPFHGIQGLLVVLVGWHWAWRIGLPAFQVITCRRGGVHAGSTGQANF
jgi:hypothetical protein